MTVTRVDADGITFVASPSPLWTRLAVQGADAAVTGIASSLLIDRYIANRCLTTDNPLIYMGGGIVTAALAQAARGYVVTYPPSRKRDATLRLLGGLAPLSAGYLATSVGHNDTTGLPSRFILGAAIACGWAAIGRQACCSRDA